MDARLLMDLITRAAVALTDPIDRVLDVGCGAGNNTIRLRMETGRDFASDLLDLSPNMLARAAERVADAGATAVQTFEADFRTAELTPGYDVILAAAVLHHLREEAEWESGFAKLFSLLRPGGSVWITDLVTHELDAVDRQMWDRWETHLAGLGKAESVAGVKAYVDAEDSPRPVTFQLELLRRVGFTRVELLHKNGPFAAFGAVRP